MTDSHRGPSPEAAYTQWVAACADAGWHAGQLVEALRALSCAQLRICLICSSIVTASGTVAAIMR